MCLDIKRWASNVAVSLVLIAAVDDARGVSIGIDEVFSSAGGGAQYLLLNTIDAGLPAGTLLTVSDDKGTRSVALPNALPREPLNRSFLVATQTFASLRLIQPDFIIPDGFLPIRKGSIAIGGNTLNYDHLPTDGFKALWADGDLGINVIARAWAQNFAGDSASIVLPISAPNRSGLWWSAPAGSEPGWAVAVDHQGDTVVAVLATYGVDGAPTWFVMPRADLYIPDPFMDDIEPHTTWQGIVYRSSGTPFNGAPRSLSATAVGAGGFHFPRLSNEGAAVLYWAIDNADAVKPITRQVYGGYATECVTGGEPGFMPNHQGLWWNPAEPGWALYVTDQGALFAVWFTYDAAGSPTWFSMLLETTTPFPNDPRDHYVGSIYRTTGGSAFAAAFDRSKLTATVVGSATLTFTSRSQGTFSYTVGDYSRTTSIEREIFAGPPSVCD